MKSAFCCFAVGLWAASILSGIAAEKAKPLNVVIILADDLGYGDAGCYGATKLKTPNIDTLALEGVRFTQAYTPGSVCSPTRYGLLAGRYFWRNPRHHPTGVHAPGGPLLFEQDRLTLAKLFQQNGYATACIGKWHQGFGEDYKGTSACGPYGDFVQELDTNVGWIMGALRKKGVLENTLVIFTSDNGGVVADNERLLPQWQAKQAGHAICGALRGRKHSVYEGGFRVPFIVRWPDLRAQGTRSDVVICLTDVMASCAGLLGAKLPEHAAEDSFDALAAWKGDAKAHVRDAVVLDSANGIFAIREGDWKLIVRDAALASEKGNKKQLEAENQNQLYNLADDPAETKNLWAEQPDVVKRLGAGLTKARQADHTRP